MLQNEASDEFHDAVEELPLDAFRGSDLATSIEQTRHAMNLFFNNNFDEAVAYMKRRASDSMYHSLGFATMSFIQALMTCNDQDVEKAMLATKNASDVCDRLRKPTNLAGRFGGLSSSVGDDDNCTDEQVHAELCYAEALLERALLTFVQDENMISFLKGAYRIRACFQSYKKCNRFLFTHAWQSERIRSHFESGVKLGDGTFSLLISALPSRVLRLLEFVGFNGNREYGLSQLRSAALMHCTLRWPLSTLVLLVWNLMFVYILGTGESDLQWSEHLLRDMLSKYPKSSLVLFFAGRYAEIGGEFSKAIKLLKNSIDQQSEWRQFHHLCFWELIFCHAYLRQWREARQYAEHLFMENRWSRSSYAYFCACLLIAEQHDLDQPSDSLIRLTVSYMREVPALRVRLSGKSLPLEKFCSAKSAQFSSQNNWLFIPVYELLYLWNCFACMGKDDHTIIAVLEDIERQYTLQRQRINGDLSPDDYCLYLLMKAMCLKQLHSPYQAEKLLKELVQQSGLKVNTYLVPNAYLELTLLRLESDDLADVKRYLAKAKEAKGYLLESRMHFRVHSIEERLKKNQEKTCDQTKIKD